MEGNLFQLLELRFADAGKRLQGQFAERDKIADLDLYAVFDQGIFGEKGL